MSEQTDRLVPLWKYYRDACPSPEPGAAFMPGLWERIDARRNFLWKLRLYTRGLVSLAAAACIAMAVFSTAGTNGDIVYTQTYVETLSGANTVDTMAYADYEEVSLPH